MREQGKIKKSDNWKSDALDTFGPKKCVGKKESASARQKEQWIIWTLRLFCCCFAAAAAAAAVCCLRWVVVYLWQAMADGGQVRPSATKYTALVPSGAKYTALVPSHDESCRVMPSDLALVPSDLALVPSTRQ